MCTWVPAKLDEKHGPILKHGMAVEEGGQNHPSSSAQYMYMLWPPFQHDIKAKC